MAGLNMRAQTAAKIKKPKKELDHIRTAEAENGGHTAYHHYTQEFDHPPEGPHIFPKHGEPVPVVEGHLFHHMAQHLNIPHEVIGKDGEGEGEHDPVEEEEMEPE